MVYNEIVEKLGELEQLTAVGFPDGSVDTYVQMMKGKSGRITDRHEVAKKIEENSSASFRVTPERREPGGKSFNMSLQCDSLGLETAHYGYLNNSIFNHTGFQTYSMGTPADVTIAEFENGSLLLSEETPELTEWKLEDLKKFNKLEEVLSADVICCANWTSIHHMTSELEKIAEEKIEAEVFSFDPGNLTDIESDRIKEMFTALEKISERSEVQVHANSDEVKRTAEIYGIEGETSQKINQVQETTGIDAYILHDKYRAVAGTEEGVVEVENLVTDHVETRTGAGDRFDAGVSAGRAAGWSWEESLALGNLCAVQYVENNKTATPETIRKQVEEKVN
ncbi:MAG: hypothetical protein ACI9LV_000291 [Candidatus Nanohaloarchaea archaeon]|jgi:hypothetical protein